MRSRLLVICDLRLAISKSVLFFLFLLLSLPGPLRAQNEVLSVPLVNIQPYDPTQPLQQMYCDPAAFSLGTNLQEWQVASSLAWNDPSRDRTHPCYIDCHGQLHCNSACSAAFTSGCAGSSNPVNWYVNGTLIGTEPGGNFDNGTNTTWSGLDDPSNHRVDITVNAAGGTGGACGPAGEIVQGGYVCAGPPALAPLAPPILDQAFGYSTTSTSVSASLPQPVSAGQQILVAAVCDDYPVTSTCAGMTTASNYSDSLGDTYALIGPGGSAGYMGIQFAIATAGSAGSVTVTLANISSSNTYGLGVFKSYNIGGYDTRGVTGGVYQSNIATASATTTHSGDLLIGIGFNLSDISPLILYQNSGDWALLGNSGQITTTALTAWGWSGTYSAAAGTRSLTWSSTSVNGLYSGQVVAIYAFSPASTWPTTGVPSFRNLYATDIPSTLWLADLDMVPVPFLQLPACTTGLNGTQGTFRFVTDSTTAVQGATITGGGTSPVFGGCDGTNWVVMSGAANASQIPQCYSSGSGGSAYACTLSATSPDAVILYPDAANTGASATLNVNSTAACPIYKYGGTTSTLTAGDIAYPGGTAYLMLYLPPGGELPCKWIIASQINGGGGFPTLNQVLDPTANKDFTMGGYYLALDGGNFGAGGAPALSVDVDANRAPFITPPVFTPGTPPPGLNNATFSGTPGLPVRQFCVAIDSLGTDGGPDTFSWGVAGSCTSGATLVPITAVAQLLTSGVSVTFAYGGPPYQGHSLGDQWNVTSSRGGIINAAAGFQIGYTATDGHCLVGSNGVYQDGSCGSGSPGLPLGSIQGNNAGAFAGIPGSTVDFTNGLMTLAPPGTGTPLYLVGDNSGSDAFDISAGSTIANNVTWNLGNGIFNLNSPQIIQPAYTGVALAVSGDSAGSTPLEVNSTAAADGATIILGPPATPGSATGLSVTSTSYDNGAGGAASTGGSFSSVLGGPSAPGDNVTGINVSATNDAALGLPDQIAGIVIGPVTSPASPAQEQWGLIVSDNASDFQATNISGGIEIEPQTPGPHVYAISTGRTGPVSLGDIVSPGILNLADGLAEIANGWIGSVTFTGSGTNDMTTSGTYVGPNATYCVQVDGSDTPDTFEWGTDPSCTVFTATAVPMTGSPQLLSNGVYVTFAATTTHTVGDHWTFAAAAPLSDGYEFNCADCDTPTAEGAVCTNAGDHAGARAIYIRGAAHCF